MSDVVLFHHIQGLTDGVRELAERLREGGHTVHTPDLFAGERPDSLEAGFALVESLGDDVIGARVEAALDGLPDSLVYAGISFGVMTAQRLAQTRPGATGALLYEAFLPISGEWAIGPWPDGVPVQVHGREDDPFFGHEGDLDAARELVRTVPDGVAELHVYPGSEHLFVDSSLPSYDATATAQVVARSRALLDRVG